MVTVWDDELVELVDDVMEVVVDDGVHHGEHVKDLQDYEVEENVDLRIVLQLVVMEQWEPLLGTEHLTQD